MAAYGIIIAMIIVIKIILIYYSYLKMISDGGGSAGATGRAFRGFAVLLIVSTSARYLVAVATTLVFELSVRLREV